MSSSLESSIVRICNVNGLVVGAGFLVGGRQVLTCAHVVAGALGLADDTPEKPQAPVCLDVPRVAPGKLLTARVVLWRPPRADGGDDIAGLELDGDPPQGARVAPLAQVEDLWEHTFRAFGFPRGQDTGVWTTGRLLGRQVTNWVQIEDVKETGFAVEPGFSGTPVWDTQTEAVVGMVVAAERRMNLKTAFAIPVDVLAASWPLLESLIHPFVRAGSDERMSYLDFELEIGPGSGREYPVAVVRSAAGEARETMHFPFGELALESRLKDLQIALLRSGGRYRQMLSVGEQVVQDFGRALFDALFTGEVCLASTK